MTNTNFHPDMNDNNDNGTIQSMDATSEIVAEVPYDTAVSTMNQEIDNLIVFDDNQHNVTLGQTENSPASDRQRFFNIRRRPKTLSCIVTAIIFPIFVLVCVRLVRPLDAEDTPVHDALMYVTLDDNQQGLITKEEDDCFCANAIEENELDVNFNNENNAPITYTSKWTHLKKTPVFNKLFGLKDNIIAIIPTDHDENSLDTYDRTDVSKIEPNDVVSTEDVRPTNLYIPKGTSSINSNEEIVEKNAA